MRRRNRIELLHPRTRSRSRGDRRQAEPQILDNVLSTQEQQRTKSVRVSDLMSIEDVTMPRGDKSKYTDKQERKAEHIADSYEERGISEKEAERRAWATVNKDDAGGNKSGSGHGKRTGNPAAHQGGKKGGEASASRSAEDRSKSAKKAAATRKKNKARA
jgi:plasmid stabilization system protein ParE